MREIKGKPKPNDQQCRNFTKENIVKTVPPHCVVDKEVTYYFIYYAMRWNSIYVRHTYLCLFNRDGGRSKNSWGDIMIIYCPFVFLLSFLYLKKIGGWEGEHMVLP